ncbi:glycosyltransferase family 2 protein [Rheinheimera marina]|uniref:Glycosyltransferase family 2 protein n=1 Tax=Rheinheimera marina TaxID=1774958 RepID=A0ABV9JRT7_9GAMM
MKLSVIVPAYNLSPFILECLLSLLSQKTTFDYEVLVCNDCSPDNTLHVIHYLAADFPQLKILNNETNQGLVGTMRRLLQEATGDYIAYLDGDDVALPGKLQRQVDYLDQNPSCALVYHESDVFDAKTGKTLKLFSRDYYNAAYVPQRSTMSDLIKYSVYLQASSVMFRRHSDLLNALDHGNRIICDFPWHIMNVGFLKGSIDRIDDVLGRYRIHAQSFGGQTQVDPGRRIKVADEMAAACRLGERFGVAGQVIQQGVNHIYFSTALYFLKLGEYTLFSQMIERSVQDELYFDQRHRLAYLNRANPELVRQELGFH